MKPESSEDGAAKTTIEQSGQIVKGTQVNIGGDAQIDQVGDRISGDVVISGRVDGDVHVTYERRDVIPPPPTPDRPPHPALFVGREKELSSYKTALNQTGLAVISGMAGVGKSALAAQLARDVAKPEKIFWHSFHEGEGIEGIIWRLAGFLAANGEEALWAMLQNAQMANSRPPPPELLFDYLVQLTRGRGLLLSFDDFHYVDDNPLLNQLVDRLGSVLLAGELQVIITSRQAPDFVPPASLQVLGGLSTSDLDQLLAAHELTLEEAQITQLHNYTGGNAEMLTLAIDLLLGGYEAQELLARMVEIDDIEDFLMNEIEDRLTRSERQAMGGVAVLMGYPGSRAAVEAILDSGSLRRILHDLGDRFLLTIFHGEEGRLYSQHAIVRDFFYEGLSRRERHNMHLRAAAFYNDEAPDTLAAIRHFHLAGENSTAVALAMDKVYALLGQGQATALSHLLAEIERGQLATEQWITARIICGQVYSFLGQNGRAEENLLDARNELDSLPPSQETADLHARVCLAMGDLLRQQAPQKALKWYQRGRDALNEDTAQHEAALSIGQGTVYTFLEQFEEAKGALEAGLALLDGRPSQLLVTAIENLGVVYFDLLGDADRAVALTEEALAVSVLLDDQFKKAELLSTLGTFKHQTNDWPGAMVDFQQAWHLARQLGNDKILAMTEANLGHALMLSGDYESAERHLAAGLDLFVHTKQQIFACQAMVNIAQLHLYRQQWPAAAAILKQCKESAHDLDAGFLFPQIMCMQAEVALETGHLEAAGTGAQEALIAARESDDKVDIGLCLQVWGRIMSASKRFPEASAAFEESVNLLQGIDALDAARTKAAWGMTLVSAGDIEQGNLLLGEARATLVELGAHGHLAAVDKQLEQP